MRRSRIVTVAVTGLGIVATIVVGNRSFDVPIPTGEHCRASLSWFAAGTLAVASAQGQRPYRVLVFDWEPTLQANFNQPPGEEHVDLFNDGRVSKMAREQPGGAGRSRITRFCLDGDNRVSLRLHFQGVQEGLAGARLMEAVATDATTCTEWINLALRSHRISQTPLTECAKGTKRELNREEALALLKRSTAPPERLEPEISLLTKGTP